MISNQISTPVFILSNGIFSCYEFISDANNSFLSLTVLEIRAFSFCTYNFVKTFTFTFYYLL